jgi:hypothetical protein
VQEHDQNFYEAKSSFLDPALISFELLTKRDKALLYRVSSHLDRLDQQLEKLEAKEVDVYWQVPASVSFELAEIQYKLIKAKERMERVLSIKKARRGA